MHVRQDLLLQLLSVTALVKRHDMMSHVLVDSLHGYGRRANSSQVRVLRVQRVHQPRQVALHITAGMWLYVLTVGGFGDGERLHEGDEALQEERRPAT